MTRRCLALFLAILLPLTLAACGDGADSGTDGAGGGDDGAGMMNGADAPGGTASLDQGTLDRYLAAAKELKELGADAGADMEASSTDIGKAATALSYNAAWEGKLSAHGFTWSEFMQVHTAVMMAFGAQAMEASRAEMEQSLAEAKASMPPAQYEMMKKSMEGALGMYGNVPPENRALVEKNEAKIKAAWEME